MSATEADGDGLAGQLGEHLKAGEAEEAVELLKSEKSLVLTVTEKDDVVGDRSYTLDGTHIWEEEVIDVVSDDFGAFDIEIVEYGGTFYTGSGDLL